jgi:hypothetical protein
MFLLVGRGRIEDCLQVGLPQYLHARTNPLTALIITR